jgi:L-ribulose-5-phosphate 3-epimerase
MYLMNRREALKLSAAALTGAHVGRPAAAAARSVGARLRPAICAYSYRDALGNKTMTYEDLIRRAVEFDADGIDMTVYWFPNTSDGFLLPLRRTAYKSAVEIYSICVSTDMCQPSRELQDREVAKVRGWVDVAEKLGAGHIRVFGGVVPKSASEDQAAKWVTEVLKRASEYSGSKGIILGLENHGGITSRAERVLQIVHDVDSPWVGVNLDTGNFESSPYSQIERCVPYAVNVQFKAEIKGDDGKEQPSDWNRILDLLVHGGYKGYVSLEYEGKQDPSTAVPELMAKLRGGIRSHVS